jgi:hypothetical protein
MLNLNKAVGPFIDAGKKHLGEARQNLAQVKFSPAHIKPTMDSFMKAAVSELNIVVNRATQVYHQEFNRHLNISATQEGENCALFHYDVKATLYNGATVVAALKVAAVIFNPSTFLSGLFIICSTLLFQRIVDQSMSTLDNAKSTADKVWSALIGINSAPPAKHALLATTSMAAAKALNKAKDRRWSEDMISIGQVSILKNWHFTIPSLLHNLF